MIKENVDFGHKTPYPKLYPIFAQLFHLLSGNAFLTVNPLLTGKIYVSLTFCHWMQIFDQHRRVHVPHVD